MPTGRQNIIPVEVTRVQCARIEGKEYVHVEINPEHLTAQPCTVILLTRPAHSCAGLCSSTTMFSFVPIVATPVGSRYYYTSTLPAS